MLKCMYYWKCCVNVLMPSIGVVTKRTLQGADQNQSFRGRGEGWSPAGQRAWGRFGGPTCSDSGQRSCLCHTVWTDWIQWGPRKHCQQIPAWVLDTSRKQEIGLFEISFAVFKLICNLSDMVVLLSTRCRWVSSSKQIWRIWSPNSWWKHDNTTSQRSCELKSSALRC